MYEILIVVAILAVGTFVSLYAVDRQLKYFAELNIKKVKLLTLTKSKRLFVYYNRKENVITKDAFISMIIFYIINTLGILLLLAHFIAKSDLLFKFSVGLFCSNLLLFSHSAIRLSLKYEQQKIVWEDQKKYRKMREEQKKNRQK